MHGNKCKCQECEDSRDAAAMAAQAQNLLQLQDIALRQELARKGRVRTFVGKILRGRWFGNQPNYRSWDEE